MWLHCSLGSEHTTCHWRRETPWLRFKTTVCHEVQCLRCDGLITENKDFIYIYILTTIPHYTSVKLVYLWIILYWNVWLKKLLFDFLTWVSYKEIINEFWLETRAEFPIISETDLNLHLSFRAVYLHEAVFSALVSRKSSCLSVKGIPLLDPLPLLRMRSHFFKGYF